jgi:hypothetical protein
MFNKRTFFAVLAVAVLTACDSSTAPGARTVNLSFAGTRPAGVAAGFRAAPMPYAVGDSLVISDGTNTLIITSAEVVAREIELRRAGVVSCDSSASRDDCEYFSTNARLITLPLASGVSQSIGVEVPAGTYESLRMKVHKVSDDPGDAAFLAANPSWPDGESIRVTGFYNGTPFTFVSDVNFDAEEDLVPALVIGETSQADLTVRIDLTVWFRQGLTGSLINPATAGSGGGNKSTVENNIKNSVRVFKDDDHDGDERDG